MRRISVTLDDRRRLEVGYEEPSGRVYEIKWYLFGSDFGLSDADCRKIEFSCLHDLVERRGEWQLALKLRQLRQERSA
jgi:hypothetical protein